MSATRRDHLLEILQVPVADVVIGTGFAIQPHGEDVDLAELARAQHLVRVTPGILRQALYVAPFAVAARLRCGGRLVDQRVQPCSVVG